MSNEMRFIATCKLGLESVVAGELRALGIEVESVSDARIVFRGGFDAMALPVAQDRRTRAYDSGGVYRSHV